MFFLQATNNSRYPCTLFRYIRYDGTYHWPDSFYHLSPTQSDSLPDPPATDGTGTAKDTC